MNIPDLSRIIDTYIPIVSYENYYNQLQQELIPPIRKLQNEDLLNWFSFLIHSSEHLSNRESMDNKLYIHLRLEPKNNVTIDMFITKLPKHFIKPIQVPLGAISGLDPSFLQDENWAYAWKLLGESSEWVLSLIESHKKPIPLNQIIQFLHFITNPLLLGGKCIFFPNGFLPF